LGNPSDLSNAITFLLGEESAWMTGQVLAVDGGMGKLKV
jgi:NAD(P)-dependent dehydrogenase (short-subunit alcohol dehydrogenase family)